MIYLLIAYILTRVKLLVTRPHFNNRYAGWGAVMDTLHRRNQAPMRYRVLVPWLIGSLERLWPRLKMSRLAVYLTIRWLSIWLALFAVDCAWGPQVAVLTAGLVPITFFFDYWNWPFELAAVAFAMTGSLPLILGSGFLLALSKETAPIVGLAAYASTGDVYLAGAVFLLMIAVLLIVRMVQEERPMYCDRVMLTRNWRMLKGVTETSPKFLSDPVVAIVVSAMIVLAILAFPPGWYVPLVLLVAGWVLALAHETRIFVAAFPWIAVWLLS